MVRELKSVEEFNEVTGGEGLVMVDFYADWCGPCKMIAPKIDEYAEKYSSVTFVKVNIDQVQAAPDISSIPTFRFYKGGKQVAEVVGANPAVLEAKISEMAA